MSKTTDIAHNRDLLRHLGTLTGDHTMPTQQVTLLLSLYVDGEMNQSQLEEITGVKRSSNSRNIAKLGRGEQAWAEDGPGLVESFEDLQDRRLKLVRLTPKGRALLDECWARTYEKHNAAVAAKAEKEHA